MLYVIVIPQYGEGVITGRAEDKCNSNDIIQVYGYNYFMPQCVEVCDNAQRFTDS